jgi:TRAP-type C4-dicarboxylate transport system permease small subunit
MRWLEKAADALNSAMTLAAAVAVLLLMLLAVANVTLREARLPFEGAYELVGFLGAVVVAFSLGRTQAKKSHVAVDIITRRFPKRVNRAIDRFRYLAKMLFAMIASWRVFLLAERIRTSGEVSETLKLPYFPFVYCVALGFVVLALTVLVDLTRTFTTREGPTG